MQFFLDKFFFCEIFYEFFYHVTTFKKKINQNYSIKRTTIFSKLPSKQKTFVYRAPSNESLLKN